MKRIFITASCLCILALNGCKNDRGDDTHLDTSSLTASPALADPTPDTPLVTTDSGPEKTAIVEAPAKNTAANASGKVQVPAATTTTRKEETPDIRTRKTSRKGRIILAALRNNTDKIELDKEGIYNRAEIMPSYPGGEEALRRFIEGQINYPDNAIDNNVEGTVRVYFAVDEQGKISSPTVVSTKLGYGLEQEAIRVVNQMPKWTPGQVKGKTVKTRFTLPITYKIE